MEHKRDVEYFYSLTRSDEYRSVVNAINQISPYIEEIAGALEFIRLGWLANYIRMIPLAGEIMDEATKWSGTAKNAVDAMELFPPEKVKGYVDQVKSLVKMLPLDKFRSYIQQAIK